MSLWIHRHFWCMCPPPAMRHRCCRCNKPFIIYNSGQYQTVEECVYHYGRLIKSTGMLEDSFSVSQLIPHSFTLIFLPLSLSLSPFLSSTEYGEGVVSLYSCCQERRDSLGCQVAKVTDTIKSSFIANVTFSMKCHLLRGVYTCSHCMVFCNVLLSKLRLAPASTHISPDACDFRAASITWLRLRANSPSSSWSERLPVVSVCTGLWDVLYHSRTTANASICCRLGSQTSIRVPCETITPNCGL